MNSQQTIFDLVKSEEKTFKQTPISVADGFDWSMYEHIRHCILVKDGKLLNEEDPEFTPVKNIILPIVNVNYRSEGFDVKDIEPYVDNPDKYHLSFIVRKFHDPWSRKMGMDTFIDEIVESYVDFGGVLVYNSGDKPEVIPLQTLAFCDQTDILSGPFAIKLQLSVDQLDEKRGVWNSDAIDKVIAASRFEKSNVQSNGQTSKTPGRYITVYAVHGVFPKSWLTLDTKEYEKGDEDKYSRQFHAIAFDVAVEGTQKGITLYKGREQDGLFKVLKRDKRFGTALGRSAIEELFEPQVWTNYNAIQKKAMLDKLSLMLGVTDDPTFASKNKITQLENGTFMTKTAGTTVEPFIFPANNIGAFDNDGNEWEQHARELGSASDPQLGINPSAGTPLGTTQIVTQQGLGIHTYRQGKIAVFVEEIYREWILPLFVKELNKGQQFMAELSLDELNEVADKVITNHVNDIVKKRILEGKVMTNEERDAVTALSKQAFMKGGKQKFMEILKNEIDEIPLNVRINVAGKEKNQVALVEKLSNLVRGVLANPAILQDPNAVKLLNTMLEASGISPINFSFDANHQPPAQPPQQLSTPSPMQGMNAGSTMMA